MRLYIVRHGESKSNAAQIHQSDDIRLSEQGLNQAQFLANRFVNIPIDAIWSSPFTRAKQTAQAISKVTGLTINFSQLLVEHRNPSQIIGKSRESNESLDYRRNRDKNWHNPAWRYSDEETYGELRLRVIKALTFLTNLPHENVLVVSHGAAIREMISVMILGNETDWMISHKLSKSWDLSNTGITVCDFSHENWKIITINDHAHLG